MFLGKFHNVEQRNKYSYEGNKDFPGAGIIFAVGRFILAIGPDLSDHKYDHKKYYECNLSGCEFHCVAKGNAGALKSYFWVQLFTLRSWQSAQKNKS